jgi:ABC-type phosphate transport system substrate-binding protein
LVLPTNNKEQFKEIKMKKIINTAAFAALIVGAAVTAQAADIQVNMYGASAQLLYWETLGDDFLLNATTGMGCTNAYLAKAESAAGTTDKNSIAIKGDNCAENSGNDVYITYTSVASLEGIAAANNVAPIVPALQCDPSDPSKRKIANVAKCDFTKAGFVAGKCAYQADSSQYVCADIQLGTSDVEGPSFVQESHGWIKGHLGGATYENIDLNEAQYDAAKDISTLASYSPTIVPFAFFMNNKVGTTPFSGDQSNLTRTQAVNLFAGKVKTWNKLKGFDSVNRSVILCLRHASSGTHATLDKAIFRGDNLSIVKNENPFVDPVSLLANSAPFAYFYQSSSDLYTCVDDNAGKHNSQFTYGAVGYADADAASKMPNSRIMKYQGVPAIDTAGAAAGVNNYINKGSYDFWSSQQVYVQDSSTENTPFVIKLMTFAENNIPTDKYGIWTKKSALKVDKPSDTDIPVLKP